MAGDYGVRGGERWLAVVERKSIEDFIGSLSNGTLAFQLAAMTELPLAAVVVEGRYPKLFDVERVKDGWLPDVLARLQIRYREIPIVFADSIPPGGSAQDRTRLGLRMSSTLYALRLSMLNPSQHWDAGWRQISGFPLPDLPKQALSGARISEAHLVVVS